MVGIAAIAGGGGDEIAMVTTVDGIVMVTMVGEIAMVTTVDGTAMMTMVGEIAMVTTVGGIAMMTMVGEIVMATMVGEIAMATTMVMVDTDVGEDNSQKVAVKKELCGKASRKGFLGAFSFPLSKKEPYVTKRCGGAEQRTVKAVQKSSVSRKELGTIFDPCFALEEGFRKITDRTDNANHCP